MDDEWAAKNRHRGYREGSEALESDIRKSRDAGQRRSHHQSFEPRCRTIRRFYARETATPRRYKKLRRKSSTSSRTNVRRGTATHRASSSAARSRHIVKRSYSGSSIRRVLKYAVATNPRKEEERDRRKEKTDKTNNNFTWKKQNCRDLENSEAAGAAGNDAR